MKQDFFKPAEVENGYGRIEKSIESRVKKKVKVICLCLWNENWFRIPQEKKCNFSNISSSAICIYNQIHTLRKK